MGPLYYAGSVDQIEICIRQVRERIPGKLMEYVRERLNIQPNADAGSPQLSKEWNECLAAIMILAEKYDSREYR